MTGYNKRIEQTDDPGQFCALERAELAGIFHFFL